MKIAVFGANSYIGGHFCSHARARGDEIVAYSVAGGWIDSTTGAVNPGLRLADRLDGVLYLSQSPLYRQHHQALWHMQAVNAAAPARIAAMLAQSSPGAHFVYLSTGTVYRRAFVPLAEDAPLNRRDGYALSKIQGEEALATFAPTLETTVARLFGIFGPRQTGKLVPNLMEAVRARRAISVQPHPTDPSDVGGFRISLCHVDDAVAGLRRLFDLRGVPVINLAGLRPFSIREIAQALEVALGIPARIEMAATAREGDLIADVTLMKRYLTMGETDIARIARAMAEAAA